MRVFLGLAMGLLMVGLGGVPGCADPDDGSPSGSDGSASTPLPGDRGPAVRDDPAEGHELAACREVLIRHHGAIGAPDSVTRGREEARHLAEEVVAVARAGADFDSLVARHSEGHSRDRHGFVDPFKRGTRPRAFEEAVFPLQVGEIAGPIESPYGFHVVIREAGQTFRAAQILIGYAGAQGATGAAAARSRSDAVALVARLRERVVAHTASFGWVAREFTDGPRKQMGGNVGTLTLYSYGRLFGEVVAELDPGEISEVFETRQGFNIVKRTR